MAELNFFQRQEIHTETMKSCICSLEIPKNLSYPISVTKRVQIILKLQKFL